jgi:hypothetical protein
MIKLSFPLNITSNEKKYFIGKENYKVDELKIIKKKNLFISHEGLVYKNLKLVPKSMFNIKGKLDKTFYWEFWKLASEQFFVSTYGKSLKKISLNNQDYLHIYTKWFGYFFWITDSLPKLIKTKSQHGDLKLIYPERWLNNKYVNDSLKMFPNIKKDVIEKDTHLQVKSLFLPQTRQWSNAIDPNEINKLREFIFNYLDNHREIVRSKSASENIFISREKANRRKISNQEKVNIILEKYNFTSIFLEDYSFFEQVNILRNAKNIIGVHGAGLVNIVFKQKKGNVLEISPKPKNKNEIRIPFWRISNCVNAKYFIQFCEIDKLTNNEIYDSNLFVDVKKLEENINLMI